MSCRPPLPNYDGLSRGYKKRLGYGDAMDDRPMFSSDRFYREGYEQGKLDAKAVTGTGMTIQPVDPFVARTI
ncbi:hypothetical protein [Rhizobium sp. BK176]|uniref:hypothetical protein n=1 Tax=Rhizobium sp. BK176 TaxID=2587071 RepID=UPI002168942A|nr:hypothetical protein [Rhizobium sp. BK176]MCS4089793.1 hypothetical protein [Rhizobium sp. BK176]